MIRVDAFRTSDGAMHATLREARNHADRRYGDALTAHAHKLAQLTKYGAITEYLDANAEALATLAHLKADLALTDDDAEA